MTTESSENSEFFKQESKTTSEQIVCKNCGKHLKFEPGKESLVCGSCQTVNEIASASSQIQENDYLSAIRNLESGSSKQEVHTVKCGACASQTTLKANEISADCPYCGGNLIVDQQETHNALKPEYVLPFKVDDKKAINLFKNWISSLWWAPGKLKKIARQSEKLQGVYYPYWTYDTFTTSQYSGERGDDYTETEYYETTDSDGNTVTQSRQVTHTNWTYTSGTVTNNFDDVMVVASESLPTEYVQKLEPWDLENLKEYNDQYLPGFRAETYFTGLEEGFEIAKSQMQGTIDSTVRNNIGGDHQRVHSCNTSYDNIKFKHLLLPIWISAYRYNSKIYRFVINGRTGEVQGERPYSWVKITLAIATALAAIGLAWYLFS